MRTDTAAFAKLVSDIQTGIETYKRDLLIEALDAEAERWKTKETRTRAEVEDLVSSLLNLVDEENGVEEDYAAIYDGFRKVAYTYLQALAQILEEAIGPSSIVCEWQPPIDDFKARF